MGKHVEEKKKKGMRKRIERKGREGFLKKKGRGWEKKNKTNPKTLFEKKKWREGWWSASY